MTPEHNFNIQRIEAYNTAHDITKSSTGDVLLFNKIKCNKGTNRLQGPKDPFTEVTIFLPNEKRHLADSNF